MNNISQKNIVFGFQETDQLPYLREDIRFRDGQSIDAINLNNTFQQLRDNDLFLENLVDLNANAQVGPQKYSSRISANFEDGTKWWYGLDSYEQPKILHKQNQEISSTIEQKFQLSARYVTASHGYYFAALSGKVVYSSDGFSWNTLVDGDSYAYMEDPQNLYVGLGNGIVAIREVDSGGQLALSTESILEEGYSFDGHPTAIAEESRTRMILVGDSQGNIYSGNSKNPTESLFPYEFEKQEIRTADCGQVNDFKFRTKDQHFDDANYIIASTTSGLIESDFDSVLVGKETFDVGAKIYELLDFDGMVVAATENGLRNLSGETIALKNTNVKDAFVSDNKLHVLSWADNVLSVCVFDNLSHYTVAFQMNIIPGAEVPNCFTAIDGRTYAIATNTKVRICDTDMGVVVELASNHGANLMRANKYANRVYLAMSYATSQNKPRFEVVQLNRGADGYIVHEKLHTVKDFSYDANFSGNPLSGLVPFGDTFLAYNKNEIFGGDGAQISSIGSNDTILDITVQPTSRLVEYAVRYESGGQTKFKLKINGMDSLFDAEFGGEQPIMASFGSSPTEHAMAVFFDGQNSYLAYAKFSALSTERATYQIAERVQIASGGQPQRIFESENGGVFVLVGTTLYMFKKLERQMNKTATCEFKHESDADGQPLQHLDGIRHFYGNTEGDSWMDDGQGRICKIDSYSISSEPAIAMGLSCGPFDDCENIWSFDENLFVSDSAGGLSVYGQDSKRAQLCAWKSFENIENPSMASLQRGKTLLIDSGLSTNIVEQVGTLHGVVPPTQCSVENFVWDVAEYEDSGNDGHIWLSSNNDGGISIRQGDQTATLSNITCAKFSGYGLYACDADGGIKIYGAATDWNYPSELINTSIAIGGGSGILDFRRIVPCFGDNHVLIHSDSQGVFIDQYELPSYTVVIGTGTTKYGSNIGHLVKIASSDAKNVATSGSREGGIVVWTNKTTDMIDYSWLGFQYENETSSLTPGHLSSHSYGGQFRTVIEGTLRRPERCCPMYADAANRDAVQMVYLYDGKVYGNNLELSSSLVYLTQDDVQYEDVDDIFTNRNGTQLYLIKGDQIYDCANDFWLSAPHNLGIKECFSEIESFIGAANRDGDLARIDYIANDGFEINPVANHQNLNIAQVAKYDDAIYALSNGHILCVAYDGVDSISGNWLQNAFVNPQISNVVDFAIQDEQSMIYATDGAVVYGYGVDDFGNPSVSATWKSENVEGMISCIRAITEYQADFFGLMRPFLFKTQGGEYYQGLVVDKNAVSAVDEISVTYSMVQESRSPYGVYVHDAAVPAATSHNIDYLSSADSQKATIINGKKYRLYDSHGKFALSSSNSNGIQDYGYDLTTNLSCVDGILGGVAFKDENFYVLSTNGSVLSSNFNYEYHALSPQTELSVSENVVQIDTDDSRTINLVASENGAENYYRYAVGASHPYMVTYVDETTRRPYVDFDKAFIAQDGTAIAYKSTGRYFVQEGDRFMKNWDVGYEDISSLNGACHNAQSSAYYVFGNDDKVLEFIGYDPKHRIFHYLGDEENPKNFRKFLEIGENEYLVESDDGLYYLKDDRLLDMSISSTQIASLHSVVADEYRRMFMYSIGDRLFMTDNYRKMSDSEDNMVLWIQQAGRINDALRKNKFEYIVCTNNGLFVTKYTYKLTNDLTYISEYDLNNIYKEMLSVEISAKIADDIDEHVLRMHNSHSLIPFVNSSIVGVDFNGVGNRTNISRLSGEFVVKHDVLDDIEYGDSSNCDFISVYTSNFLQDDTPSFSYIKKKYRSGFEELYLLLETTNTYYINHISGAGATIAVEAPTSRMNLEGFGIEKSQISSGGPSDYDDFKTSISVCMDEDITVDNIVYSEIHGCSLPLGIYLDVDEYRSSNEITGMYQSIIGKSRYVPCRSKDGVFVYECFGTDQQSIKLAYIRTVPTKINFADGSVQKYEWYGVLSEDKLKQAGIKGENI